MWHAITCHVLEVRLVPRAYSLQLHDNVGKLQDAAHNKNTPASRWPLDQRSDGIQDTAKQSPSPLKVSQKRPV